MFFCPDNMFLPLLDNENFLMIFQDEPFIIPCRVTDPTAVVALTYEQDLVRIVEGNGVTFDPHFGFSVTSRDWDGVVACEGHVDDQSQLQLFEVHLVGEQNIIPANSKNQTLFFKGMVQHW